MAAFSVLLCFTVCFSLMFAGKVDARTLSSNETGTHGGYDYEYWKDTGNGSMTLKDGGAFSCQWSNINNILFRKGRKFNETQTHQQIGNITVQYGVDYRPSGNSYLCVYGWTVDPLVEYYIVESWGDWRPPGAGSKGTINVDGGTYDVYETTRNQQPSIKGTATFQQYWSVRTSKKTSGTISVSEHFNAWERMGMRMGKMYEVALTIEGYQSSGSADVYTNVITVGGSGGNQGGNDWNQGGNDWNQGGNDWNQGGWDWNQGGNDWNQGGWDWNQGGNDWNQGGWDWNQGGNDWNQGGWDWNQGGWDWNQGGNNWNQGWGW